MAINAVLDTQQSIDWMLIEVSAAEKPGDPGLFPHQLFGADHLSDLFVPLGWDGEDVHRIELAKRYMG